MPENCDLPVPPMGLSEDEERAQRKLDLAIAFRVFGKFGFSEGVAGHITARDPGDPNLFWVNPFGMSFNQIRVSDLICVDHEGRVVHGTRPVNRAAFIIHAQVHAARPDAVAAAHAHSLYGKAFSSLGIELAPITQDACAFYGDHGLYLNYSGVAYAEEEGKNIAAAIGDYKAAILRNHGLITVGSSVSAAAWWFVTMERSCQAQLVAMAAGTPTVVDHDTASLVRQQIGNEHAGWFQFRPLWEQIMATQPDVAS
ncbi:MAG: class II aldolase/adducin family protein [Nocardiaceae bacterium]|nr:class II aldolase/adducin family protein [Nocardiaceae bacterium]